MDWYIQMLSSGNWTPETIVYSKSEAHSIMNYGPSLTTIPKLEKHWRITFDFKPNQSSLVPVNRFDSDFGKRVLSLVKRNNGAVLALYFQGNYTKIHCYGSDWRSAYCDVNILPKIGDWTTYDVINEELEPGKCRFKVFIGGKLVFEEEKQGTREITDVTVNTGAWADSTRTEGHLRRLTIRTKK